MQTSQEVAPKCYEEECPVGAWNPPALSPGSPLTGPERALDKPLAVTNVLLSNKSGCTAKKALFITAALCSVRLDCESFCVLQPCPGPGTDSVGNGRAGCLVRTGKTLHTSYAGIFIITVT